MDNEDGELAHTLDIDADYQRLPSEIKERLDALTNSEGKEFEIAKDNLFSLMKLGGDALSDLGSLAMQSQHPRMFEVFTELTKTMIQAQRELMEMKKLDVDIKAKEGNTKPNDSEGGTTNNILVCSTSELMAMLKQKNG